MSKLQELRELTSAPMKSCADALKEADNDLNKAIEILKIKGQNYSSGRDGKLASEGILACHINEDRSCGILVEVNSETDFTARSQAFTNFVNNDVVSSILDHVSRDISFASNESSLEEKRLCLISKVKENIVIRKWWIEQVKDESYKIFSYVHTGSKLAVLLTLKCSTKHKGTFEAIANELAMQIASMNPIYISKENIPEDVASKQKEIFKAQVILMNKPEVSHEKIILGKMNAWYSDICLLNQQSVLYPKETISQIIKNNYAHQLNGKLEVINFIRAEVGLDKKDNNNFKLSDDYIKYQTMAYKS